MVAGPSTPLPSTLLRVNRTSRSPDNSGVMGAADWEPLEARDKRVSTSEKGFDSRYVIVYSWRGLVDL